MTARVHDVRKAAVAIALSLMLAACAVGPTFRRPPPPQVTGYTARPLPARTASAPVRDGQAQRLVQGMNLPGQWWKLFHSRPLDAIVAAALQANPTLQAAQAALREAQTQLYAGEGVWYPALGASGSATRERLSGNEFGQPGVSHLLTLKSASLSVSYLLDPWGGTRRQVESLAAQAQYQRFELEASDLTLTSNVVAAAVQEASLRGQIAATREIIRIEAQVLTGLKRQFAIGAAADTTVLAQAAALAQTRAQIVPLQKQLALTRDQLRAYLGRLPSERLSERFALTSLKLPRPVPVSLPSRLIEQRPDIQAAEAQMHAASAQIGVATANMLPQISLSASLGSETLGRLFTSKTGVWSIAASLTEPIFEGGTLFYRRKEAVAAFQVSAAEYRQTVIAAFQNVADALRAIELDAEGLAAQSAAERAAAASLAASRRQYHAGAISYLALLNAEQTYQQARLALVQAQAARLSDTAALFQALGGGWWNHAEVPKTHVTRYTAATPAQRLHSHQEAGTG